VSLKYRPCYENVKKTQSEKCVFGLENTSKFIVTSAMSDASVFTFVIGLQVVFVNKQKSERFAFCCIGHEPNPIALVYRLWFTLTIRKLQIRFISGTIWLAPEIALSDHGLTGGGYYA